MSLAARRTCNPPSKFWFVPIFLFCTLQRHSHTVSSLMVKASPSTCTPDGRRSGGLERRSDRFLRGDTAVAAPPGKPHCGLNTGPWRTEGCDRLGNPTTADLLLTHLPVQHS